jgi:hypothetical protein
MDSLLSKAASTVTVAVPLVGVSSAARDQRPVSTAADNEADDDEFTRFVHSVSETEDEEQEEHAVHPQQVLGEARIVSRSSSAERERERDRARGSTSERMRSQDSVDNGEEDTEETIDLSPQRALSSSSFLHSGQSISARVVSHKVNELVLTGNSMTSTASQALHKLGGSGRSLLSKLSSTVSVSLPVSQSSGKTQTSQSKPTTETQRLTETEAAAAGEVEQGPEDRSAGAGAVDMHVPVAPLVSRDSERVDLIHAQAQAQTAEPLLVAQDKDQEAEAEAEAETAEPATVSVSVSVPSSTSSAYLTRVDLKRGLAVSAAQQSTEPGPVLRLLVRGPEQ